MADPAAADAAGSAAVVRSEQRVRVDTRWRPAGRVRVAKRVVTEERTVTVTVRREELVVEHLPGPVESVRAPAGAAGAGRHPAGDSARPVLELVLSEEQVEVSTVVVPRERVRVFLDTVTQAIEVTTDVSREVVDVDVDAGSPAT